MERDWEAMAAARLQRSIEALVSRIRVTADTIEREADRNITSALKLERDLEFQTYAQVAGQALHELHTLIFNVNAANLIDAAADADSARAAKRVEQGTPVYGARKAALLAVLGSLDGWIQGAQQNHVDCGHRGENTGEECWRQYTPGDIRNMVNDAAREVGVTPFPYPANAKEDQK
jgi:hypothetical protein